MVFTPTLKLTVPVPSLKVPDVWVQEPPTFMVVLPGESVPAERTIAPDTVNVRAEVIVPE